MYYLMLFLYWGKQRLHNFLGLGGCSPISRKVCTTANFLYLYSTPLAQTHIYSPSCITSGACSDIFGVGGGGGVQAQLFDAFFFLVHLNSAKRSIFKDMLQTANFYVHAVT